MSTTPTQVLIAINKNHENISSNLTQLRKKRYEDKTSNKVCTVRAHLNKHDEIKKFAKTGQCNYCIEHKRNIAGLKNILNREKQGVLKWTDNFTKRDAVLTSISIIFTLLVIYIQNIVNSIAI